MIIGKRVRLRALEKDDLPRFVFWINDPEVRRNLTLFQPLSLAQEEKWFEETLCHPVEEQPLYIEIKDGNDWMLVGNVSLANIDRREKSAEVGIFIGSKDHWGKGYGSEALRLLIGHAFNHLNLNRIFLRVFETNPRAIRCYEKCGFQHEGRMREAHFQDGGYVDVLLMSILKSEWIEEKKNGVLT